MATSWCIFDAQDWATFTADDWNTFSACQPFVLSLEAIDHHAPGAEATDAHDQTEATGHAPVS